MLRYLYAMLFLERLQKNCAAQPEKVAIEFIRPKSTQTVTYGELESTVAQTAAWLHSLGIESGDRVAIQLPKCLHFIYLHLAVMRLGAITLPLNPGYPDRELTYFLNDSGAKLFLADLDKQTHFREIRDQWQSLDQLIYVDPASDALPINADLPHPTSFTAQPSTTALMVYTSGTTGRPKGAMTTHGNLTANLDALDEAWGWQNDDVICHVLPIFHVHGLVVALHGALHAGATAILLPKFEPQLALDTITSRRCTVFMAVPTIHKRLIEHPATRNTDLSHMRLLTSGSDRLPDDLFNAAQEVYGHTLLERYGMTETGMNLSNPLRGERRVGSVGLPLPGVEARVVDAESEQPLPDGEVGEVQIRGAHVFKGYWQMPEKTAESFTANGWLRTGDLGMREPDGYYTLKGRSKDLIITGGLNVYPPEVELVLSDFDEIAASAVIGCLDDDWGERITAVIVLREGRSLDAETIIAHCRSKLAAYKIPRTILFADALPRNALGKVQKAKLRAAFCG